MGAPGVGCGQLELGSPWRVAPWDSSRPSSEALIRHSIKHPSLVYSSDNTVVLRRISAWSRPAVCGTRISTLRSLCARCSCSRLANSATPSPVFADSATRCGVDGVKACQQCDVLGAINFVEHGDAGDAVGAELLEHFFYCFQLEGSLWAGSVHHQQEQVGVQSLFKGRMEAGDQLMWQAADEADGVGEEDGAAAGEAPGAGCEYPGWRTIDLR